MIQFMIMKTLKGTEKNYLELVLQAMLKNPFGPERQDIDKQILGKTVHLHHNKRRQLVYEHVKNTCTSLTKNNRISYQDYKDRDRLLIKYTLLFQTYHLYSNQLDILIQTQLKTPHQSIQVPFANEFLDKLHKYGFDKKACLKYLALCYQIRRTYYFIEQHVHGESTSINQLRQQIWNNIFTKNIQHYDQFLWDRMDDFSILILGKTGTGKGVCAAAIGYSSFIPFDDTKDRFKESFCQTFQSINLSQFPESLIETELFGYEKVAFTGDEQSKKGLLNSNSSYGTLFLDEIGEVSQPIQIKLLRVLQEREFTPVGGTTTLPFKGRIIAATNRSIAELRDEKRLRDDFYFRLSSDVIQVPSLQERIESTPQELTRLITILLTKIIGHSDTTLQKHCSSTLKTNIPKHYHWPGNVRELEQALRQILIKGSYQPSMSISSQTEQNQLTQTAESLLSEHCYRLFQQLGSYQKV